MAAMYPKARRDGMIAQPVDGELILYDGAKTHLLNATAAAVWQKCDGHHSVAEIARELALDPQTIEYSLQQMERNHLLEAGAGAMNLVKPITRREFLKKGALAAAVIPVVKTIQLPHPDQTGSSVTCPGKTCVNNFDCTPYSCVKGCCVVE